MTDGAGQGGVPLNRWAHGDGGVDPAVSAAYRAGGWWGTDTIAQAIGRHAATQPDALAYVVDAGGVHRAMTWSEYDRRSTQLAAVLAEAGFEPGDRVAFLLPDGPEVHMTMVALGKAGVVSVGLGHRAGDAEIRHLLGRTRAKVLIAHARHRDRSAAELVAEVASGPEGRTRLLVIPEGPLEGGTELDGAPVEVPEAETAAALVKGRAVGADDVFMINSTSGTTGLPKLVVHTENRWFYFNKLAMESGGLAHDDVFFGAVPAPFGFGQWTSHFTPGILGATTLVAPRFDADETLRAIAEHKVTVLTCVSTQFIMMLNSPLLIELDLSSLRAMYTGGEAVPYERAAAFEDITGAAVLQFYGSNESGTFSRTKLTDTRERRLRTTGQIIEEMQVRVYGDDGTLQTGPVRRGIPAGRGPATCLGYLDDDAANAELLTDDRWMLMGDVVEIDADGYLSVVGRTSDIIIRGGKNISAPAVEAELAEHPDVAMVAAVAMPDEVFGERVCVYVVPREGRAITLAGLTTFLDSRGMTREWFPERLEVVEELPRSSGGKVAKGDLREDIKRRLATERSTSSGG